MNSFIYDFETLGQNPRSAPVLSVAMIRFNPSRFLPNPYTMEEILRTAVYAKFDVKSQVEEFGSKIEQETLDWWKSQSKAAQQSQLAPKKDDLDIRELPAIFEENLPEKAVVYTRGNTFDPIFLKNWTEKLKVAPVYPWWADRDTRSLIDGMAWGSGLNNKFIPEGIDESEYPLHDPRVDIALDIMRIQSLAQAISK